MLILFTFLFSLARSQAEDFQQSPYYPAALAEVTRNLPQKSFAGMEWDTLTFEQQRAVIKLVQTLDAQKNKTDQQIEFIKGLIQRFDKTSIDAKEIAEQLAAMPKFNEKYDENELTYIRLPLEQSEYLKKLAQSFASVIARLERHDINEKEFRAIAARLLIEIELTLQTTPGQNNLIANETIKFWFCAFVVTQLANLTSSFVHQPVASIASAGLLIVAAIPLFWNVMARDSKKLKPLGALPKAYARSADKVRERLRFVFWLEMQIALNRIGVENNQRRDFIRNDEFAPTMLKLLDAPTADLTKVDCGALLGTAYLFRPTPR